MHKHTRFTLLYTLLLAVLSQTPDIFAQLAYTEAVYSYGFFDKDSDGEWYFRDSSYASVRSEDPQATSTNGAVFRGPLLTRGSFQTTASAQFGVLKSETSTLGTDGWVRFVGNGLTDPANAQISATSIQSSACFYDTLRIESPGHEGEAVTLLFNAPTLSVTSNRLTIDATYPHWGNSYVDAVAGTNAYIYVNNTNFAYAYSAAQTGRFLNYKSTNWRPDTIFSVQIRVGEEFKIGMSMGTNNYLQSFGNISGSLNMDADASHSMYWGGFTGAIDSEGSPIPDFSVSSTSGTDYSRDFYAEAMRANPVPEPTTYGAYGVCALFAIIVARKRIHRSWTCEGPRGS